jgi:hypothetical protein
VCKAKLLKWGNKLYFISGKIKGKPYLFINKRHLTMPFTVAYMPVIFYGLSALFFAEKSGSSQRVCRKTPGPVKPIDEG